MDRILLETSSHVVDCDPSSRIHVARSEGGRWVLGDVLQDRSDADWAQVPSGLGQKKLSDSVTVRLALASRKAESKANEGFDRSGSNAYRFETKSPNVFERDSSVAVRLRQRR